MSAEKELAQAAADNSGPLLKYGGMVLGSFAAAVSSVGGWLFQRVVKKHDDEIAAIKGGIKEVGEKVDEKLDKTEWEQNRREVRDNIIQLHGKIERSDQAAAKRHEDLMHFLLEQSTRRRRGE